LLDRVKDDLFPGYDWHSLTPKSIETINDIVQSLLYDVDVEFKTNHPEYKTADDEVFIPYRTFKESVTEALKEALNDRVKEDCPPCDTLACADHLTDE
jgi:glycosylphosphatidylinositol transamidase (GPIT) subunit GPI8